MADHSSILSRFEGTAGRGRLTDALMGQALVARDSSLAEKFASTGMLIDFPAGTVLCEQDGCDTDVYFILDGEVEIIVNGHRVQTHARGHSVGELAAIDPSARRSATVKALTHVGALKVPSEVFTEAMRCSKDLPTRVGQQTAERLRRRGKLHRAPNPRPILFVGSSVEGLELARAVQQGLEYDNLDVCLWTDDVFAPSSTAMDDLLRESDRADFAAFVFGPDDQIHSRGAVRAAPRDNIIFELGLFMGTLGRGRAFMIKAHGTDLAIPSDLAGVSPLAYVHRPDRSPAENMATVCTKLRTAILRDGVLTTRMNHFA